MNRENAAGFGRRPRVSFVPSQKPSTARVKDQVLVVGGGPAGVAAATAAARSGRKVLLAERRNTLGGQLSVAGRSIAHRDLWLRWLLWAESELKRNAVDVRLNTTITADDCAWWGQVVVATGARPAGPPLKAPDRISVLGAWTAILRPAPLSGSILVLDGGGEWPALDAAETLATHGHAVSLVTRSAAPGHELRTWERDAYRARLEALSVRVLAQHDLVVSADGRPLALRDVAAGCDKPFDRNLGALIVAPARVSDDKLWNHIASRPGTQRVGDAVQPRCLEDAITEGTRSAGANWRLISL